MSTRKPLSSLGIDEISRSDDKIRSMGLLCRRVVDGVCLERAPDED